MSIFKEYGAFNNNRYSTLNMLLADSADDKLGDISSYFSYKIGSDTPCKVSPMDLHEVLDLISRKKIRQISKNVVC